MTLTQWFIFFLAVQVVHFLGTWKLYAKAGYKSWEAAIPVYNAVVLMKIINRPTWWTILLFIPIVNLIMFPVVWVETLRSFGKNSTNDTLLGLFTLGFYTYYINYVADVKYIENRSLIPTTKFGDFISSILFAVVVATMVHTYVLQPFTIPTSSLEKSLLIGDFLFVSKVNYGPRVPMTSVALPMVHDSIPVIHKKSYLNWPQIPYFRFPGFEPIRKNDIVVFNWPADTVYKFFDKSGRKAVDKPIDKKSNYVKRCVGTPGDVFAIKDGFVFINNKKLELPERAKPQYMHMVAASKGVSGDLLKSAGSTSFARTYIIKPTTQQQLEAISPIAFNPQQNPDQSFTIMTEYKGIPQSIIQKTGLYAQEVYPARVEVNLTLAGAEKLRHEKSIDSVVRIIYKNPIGKEIFPHDGKWTQDNFGPIVIPKEGQSVTLTPENLPLYKRIIETYEKNDLKVVGDEIRINGKETKFYKFKQDYYWMMGDNRHQSEDSRYWGFVPGDHIVGKPVFIWMSIDQDEPWSNISKKIRWERLFTFVSGEGQPRSYFTFFLIGLGAYFVVMFFIKRKKA